MPDSDLNARFGRVPSSDAREVPRDPMTPLGWLILAMRVTMETGVVLGFGAWAYHLTSSMAGEIALAIAVPAVAFGIWGLIDFRKMGEFSEPLRLVQELVISGAAALAAYLAGWQTFGLALAALSLVYHLMVYATGRRLLKE
ncbi:MAG: YrdB family protein [Dehalococcoidia bacterium]